MCTVFVHSSFLSEPMSTRFDQFMAALNDPTKEVVSVFDPLSKKQLEELELIREVSAQLQRKKQEDMKKAAAQTATAEREEDESPAEKNPKEKA